MKLKLIAAVASLTVLLGSIRWANAQWQTQSFLVKPGWTAIYLHVNSDAKRAALERGVPRF